MENKIEKFYAKKKNWKIQRKENDAWNDILDGKLMRKGEANIHIRSAKILGHSPIRAVKKN